MDNTELKMTKPHPTYTGIVKLKSYIIEINHSYHKFDQPYRCICINCNTKCSEVIRRACDAKLLNFSLFDFVHWKNCFNSCCRPQTTFINKQTNWICGSWYLKKEVQFRCDDQLKLSQFSHHVETSKIIGLVHKKDY